MSIFYCKNYFIPGSLDNAKCKLFKNHPISTLKASASSGPLHYGTNSMILRHLIFHLPTSSGVSERASEQTRAAQRSARAKQACWSKRLDERSERTSERTSDRPSTYVWILGFSRPDCIVQKQESRERKN